MQPINSDIQELVKQYQPEDAEQPDQISPIKPNYLPSDKE